VERELKGVKIPSPEQNLGRKGKKGKKGKGERKKKKKGGIRDTYPSSEN